MHHDSAVAAIADAYQATRSDQRGSNLYNEMCPLTIATTGWRLLDSGEVQLTLHENVARIRKQLHTFGQKNWRDRKAAPIKKQNFHG